MAVCLGVGADRAACSGAGTAVCPAVASSETGVGISGAGAETRIGELTVWGLTGGEAEVVVKAWRGG